jgi:hypothetical protein
MLSSLLCSGFPSGLFPPYFPTKAQYKFPCQMPRPPHSPLVDHPTNTWCEGQIMKLLIMHCSPVS